MTRPPEKSVPVSERDRDLARMVSVWDRDPNTLREEIAEQLARARHEGRLEGLEEAAVYADEHPGCAATECDAADRIARAIRALALPEGDAHE